MADRFDDFDDDDSLVVLAETEGYAVLLGEDADGEEVYNVQLGTLTLHLFKEEFDELVQLIKEAADK
ncbi:MAG: hypothetical protein GYB68_15390 [Chloroflexi bacterium]|nr:hypothetical protein [Chloroflexota bacterium]